MDHVGFTNFIRSHILRPCVIMDCLYTAQDVLLHTQSKCTGPGQAFFNWCQRPLLPEAGGIQGRLHLSKHFLSIFCWGVGRGTQA